MRNLLIHILKNFLKGIARLLPESVRGFFHEVRRVFPLHDRSQVVLFADPQTLPDYSPRETLVETLPKSQLKVTLIATALNEADNAADWLDSLLEQSRRPDEVIISDGGSHDGTLDILCKYATTFPIPLHIITAPGSNIARGRNLAIEAATHPLIACTDFGCILDTNWLQYLIAPFENDQAIALSAGYYQPLISNTTSQLAAHLFGIDLTSVNPQTFLPSGRSLAMKKEIWAQAGGYPEWLTDAGEDTLFDYQVKAQPARWAFVPAARVSWRAPNSLANLFKTYYRYAVGDGEACGSAPLYWYKIVETTLTALKRGILVVIGLILTWLTGWWSALFWGGWAVVAIVRFLQTNLTWSAQLGVRFIPYTTLLEVLGLIQASAYLKGVINRHIVKRRKIAFYQERLKSILTAHPESRGVIIYPPTHDWGFMFQRPHQMARAFARQGYLYFYCTANERTDSVFGFRAVEKRLYLSHVPMEVFGLLDTPIVYLGSAWNRSTLPYFNHPRVIYDHYDDLSVSGASEEDHLALLQQAEIVLVTSHSLLNNIRPDRPEAVFSPNGVDYQLIQEQRPRSGQAPPADLQPIIATRQPVIGYSGALAEWFDYQLLGYLAEQHPYWQFVLVGVNYDGSLDRSSLLEKPNVHWLGLKPYPEIFRYIWHFHAGIIPFLLNNITLSTSPIKLFEYLACGLPVVSTDLPECHHYPEVFIAQDYPGFSQQLQRALDIRTEPGATERFTAAARTNTWDSRVKVVIDQLI